MNIPVNKVTLSFARHLQDVVTTHQAAGFDIGKFQTILPALRRLQYEYKMIVLISDKDALHAKVTNFLTMTVKNIMKAIESSDEPKLKMYSYHDTNLIEIGAALGIDLEN